MADLFNRKLKRKRGVIFEGFDGKRERRPCMSTSSACKDAAEPGPISLPETSITDQEPVEDVNPPTYQQRRSTTWESWNGLLQEFLHIHVEGNSPSQSPSCTLCTSSLGEESIYRCTDCHPSPHAVLCHHCLETCHKHCKLHKPEIWKDGYYQPFVIFNEFELVSPDSCSDSCSRLTRTVNVLDSKGRVHAGCLFRLCSCRPEVFQYFQMGFWPASPCNPSLLAQIDFCHLWNFLTMEAQISVSAFFSAMNMCSNGNLENLKMYRPYKEGESLNAFRVFAHLHNKVLETPLCYACPKDKGQIILSMDGNFGLVHKANAAKCTLPALTRQALGQPLFLKQEEVDEFVDAAKVVSKVKGGECSQFQAGDAVRSKNKAANLNMTGVFAISCRHEIVWRMLNMRHGERLSYPVMMIKTIKKQFPSLKLLLLYDIACVLKPHIMKYYPELGHVDMVIPIFHCYGHQGSCQLSMNPRRKKGFGTADGEWTERIWSYLRSFSYITKDQTAGHREDTLTVASLHMAKKKNSVIEFALYEKIQRVKVLASELKEKMAASLSPDDTKQDILAWQEAELSSLEKKNQSKRERKTWKHAYVQNLQDYYFMSDQVTNEEDTGVVIALTQSRQSLELKLQEVESHHNMQRWSQDSSEFRDVLKNLKQEKQRGYILKLRQLVAEKELLQDAQRKHAVGMKSHERVSRVLAKTSKNISKVVKCYNDEAFSTCSTFPASIDRGSINTLSPVFQSLNDDVSQNTILTAQQKDAVRMYEMLQRCEEEEGLLSEEAQRVLANIIVEYTTLCSSSKKVPSTRYECGVNAICTSASLSCMSRLARFIRLFPEYEEQTVTLPVPDCDQLDDHDLVEIAAHAVSDEETDTDGE